MLPFNPSFRRLLNKFLPQLRNEDLDRHESLIALRQQLLIERDLAPPPIGIAGPAPMAINDQIVRATQLADAILRPFRREFRLLLRLYDHQRRQELFEGRFAQAPTSFPSFVEFVKHVAVGLVLEPSIYIRLLILRASRAVTKSDTAERVAFTATAALLVLGVLTFNNQTVGVPKPEINPVVEIDSTGQAVKHIIEIQKMAGSQTDPDHPRPLEIKIATQSVEDAVAGNYTTRSITAHIEIIAPPNASSAPVRWSKSDQYDDLEYSLMWVQETSESTQIVIKARVTSLGSVTAQDTVLSSDYYPKSGTRKTKVKTVYIITSPLNMIVK